MTKNKLRLTKDLQKRYGLDLALEIALNAERELDYILIRNEDYHFFGYGSTVPNALEMLAEDIKMTQEDFESGLINENNTDKVEYCRLERLFGKKGK